MEALFINIPAFGIYWSIMRIELTGFMVFSVWIPPPPAQ